MWALRGKTKEPLGKAANQKKNKEGVLDLQEEASPWPVLLSQGL